MNDAFLAALFEDEDLLARPEIRIHILLPKNWKPKTEEVHVLDRMLTALGFRHNERRFLYHDGTIYGQPLKDVCAPVFFFSEKEIEKPEKKPSEGDIPEWYCLPPIHQMNNDAELKRRVWVLLKADF